MTEINFPFLIQQKERFLKNLLFLQTRYEGKNSERIKDQFHGKIFQNYQIKIILFELSL
jgi:hypothetical protein